MTRFYDDSIPPGTKTVSRFGLTKYEFYDDSIPPGTKTKDVRKALGK